MGASQTKYFRKIQPNQEITFTLNGKPYIVKASDGLSPDTTLNTYLRNHVEFRDTKVMCREGGCGVCVVSVTFYNQVFQEKRTYAVNSCLIPIFSCHNWAIVTNIGIGNSQIGYHKIQETLARFGGSQCGFCSSGMVMNMYALTESNKDLTMKKVENSFGGHLCRCTGYRPIMDAFKVLAIDADPCLIEKYPDIEDFKICSKNNENCNNCESKSCLKSLCIKLNQDVMWLKLHTLQDILSLLKLIGNESYRLVAGNTGKAVYPITRNIKYWIDVRDIKELTSYSVGNSLVLGANITISDAMEIIKNVSLQNHFDYLVEVYQHFDLIANVSVRNFGTLAGNLTLKHDHHEFTSDIFLVLEAIGAYITIVQANGLEIEKKVCDYINFNMNKSIIKNIMLPSLKKDTFIFKSYKIMPRAQNTITYVNAGFLIHHDGLFNVKSARIVYGGISEHFIHAKNTEKYLMNKQLFDNNVIGEALNVLSNELRAEKISNGSSVSFREKLAKNLFYKFILAAAPKDLLDSKNISGGLRLEQPLMKGMQFYQTNEKMYPVSKPITKIEAMHQAAGESRYIDDIPSIPGEVYGAFVLAETIPLSFIKLINVTRALGSPGVIAFIDHKDIPGTNLFCSPPLNVTEEELFCSGKVLYNGQPIGVIIAETQEQATFAADLVEITYEESVEVPVFTIQDALRNNEQTRIKNLSTVEPTRKGENIKHIIKGEYAMKGQYHFTMETQNCVCIPTDDGCYDLYAGTQWMNLCQKSAASALNIPMSKINVIVKRLGGGYGAKLLRCSMISTACAVAAWKLQRPVRLILPLKTNMKAIGKRFPFFAEYETGVDENGVIQYLDATYYQDSGTSGSNEQMVAYMDHYMKSAYVHDNWNLSGNLVQTDMAGNAYARGPGSTEAISLIESIMEHITHETKKCSLEVRLANLAEDDDAAEGQTMRSFIEDAIVWAEFKERQKCVKDFNQNNKWMKKGLSVALMNHRFVIYHPYSVTVSIFAADGTVAISHGGIECGQGINTKVVQVCAYELNIPMEWISVKPSISYISPNNQMTGGSVTSEAVCYATLQACKELKKRMDPVRVKLNNPTWRELVWKSFQEEIALSAIHNFTSTSEESYNIPGVCVSEVQVDLLTGEYLILRVDLMEDVGCSINPTIDIGQIEGAFIMGLGMHTCENLIYGEHGELLTNNTWTYKIPGAKDIPADFRIKFKVDGSNPTGVLNSKACGEPALNLSIGIPFAIRNAILSSSDEDKFIEIDGPTTVEFTLCNTLTPNEKFTLK